MFVVRSAALPATPDDPLPLKSQGPDRGMIRTALVALLQIEGCCPSAPEDRLLCVFVKALAMELGA